MEPPRSRSRKNKKKSSRQTSSQPIRLDSDSDSPKQPVAGPSRLTNMPQTVTASSQYFSSDLDFIALEPEEDTQPKRPVREWDRGKNGRDRYRERDEQANGRKRRREDRDNTSAPRSMGAKKSNLKSKRYPWTAYVDWDSCRNVAQLLHKEVEAYIKYISPTSVEHEVRHMTVLLISASIKKTYPDAEVLPFGSFETKLYLPQGDIDLVVKSRTLENADKVTALRSLANIVRRTGITDKVTLISKAKVPIIKFVTSYGRLAVDISINQSNGVQAGEMINHFIREFPALRALVLIVKSFLRQRNLNEVYSGGLGSYAIVCLVVSHLQMHPKVRRAEIDSAKNLGVLMLEFFELYGKYFNYTNTGISLRHGGSYFSKQARGWRDYYRPYLLSIEDPGDISNDISKGSFGIKKVKQTFAGAYELMLSSLYVAADTLSARHGARTVDLRRGSTFSRRSDEMSVLSSILGVDQETINHRRLIQEVYDEGNLARLLGIDPLIELNLSSRATVEKRSREVESVVEAWGEADMVIESEEEVSEGEVSEGKNENGGDAPTLGHDEESRYRISACQNGGPALKRRRAVTTKSVQSGTIFVADDEDDGDEIDTDHRSERLRFYDGPDAASNSSDGIDEIERAYQAAAGEILDSEAGFEDEEEPAYAMRGKGKRRAAEPVSKELRQAYWASKSVQGYDSDSP
ncbi:hypothetical protein ACEPAI_4766 [Sanghuangporus weigelae]